MNFDATDIENCRKRFVENLSEMDLFAANYLLSLEDIPELIKCRDIAKQLRPQLVKVIEQALEKQGHKCS